MNYHMRTTSGDLEATQNMDTPQEGTDKTDKSPPTALAPAPGWGEPVRSGPERREPGHAGERVGAVASLGHGCGERGPGWPCDGVVANEWAWRICGRGGDMEDER